MSASSLYSRTLAVVADSSGSRYTAYSPLAEGEKRKRCASPLRFTPVSAPGRSRLVSDTASAPDAAPDAISMPSIAINNLPKYFIMNYGSLATYSALTKPVSSAVRMRIQPSSSGSEQTITLRPLSN